MAPAPRKIHTPRVHGSHHGKHSEETGRRPEVSWDKVVSWNLIKLKIAAAVWGKTKCILCIRRLLSLSHPPSLPLSCSFLPIEHLHYLKYPLTIFPVTWRKELSILHQHCTNRKTQDLEPRSKGGSSSQRSNEVFCWPSKYTVWMEGEVVKWAISH